MELIFTLVFLDRERANEAMSYSQLSIMFILLCRQGKWSISFLGKTHGAQNTRWEKENEVGGILIRVSSLNRKYVNLKRSRRKEEGEEDEEAWGQSEYSVTLWLREGNSEYYIKS